MRDYLFICTTSDCNYKDVRWSGQCPSCKQWNTIEERKLPPKYKAPLFKQTPLIKRYKSTGERAVFDEIWQERKHVSFLSDQPLDQWYGTEFYVNMFAHVLPKRKNAYHHFRLEKDNIILLTPEEHWLYDHSTEEKRTTYANLMKCDWNKVFKLRTELILRYNKLF